jgi:hypothetical protein
MYLIYIGARLFLFFADGRHLHFVVDVVVVIVDVFHRLVAHEAVVGFGVARALEPII